jgi:hypothetical protein
MKITTKDYIDNQIEWVRKEMQAKFDGQEKATKVYNDSLDAWKSGHNEWKTRMESLTSKTLTRNEAWIFIMAAIGIAIALLAN